MLTDLAINEIRPNNWNPNVMTREEFTELVSEVKHLGGPAKPLILRKNGHGYEIVDGEHTYRALVENGYTALKAGWYEIQDLDDFEAMRQTYKRNQHGRHNPIKQGQLFKRLMVERDLTQRALADEIGVSEGTIRNSLEYVKALEVRNGYADAWLKHYREKIVNLSVRDIRAVNEMPIELADLWLNGGAKEEDLPARFREYDPRLSVLIPLLHAQTCRTAVERMKEIMQALRLWGYYQTGWKDRVGKVREWTGGLKLSVDEALPYLELLLKSRWFKSWDDGTAYRLREALEAISRPAGDKAKPALTLETVKAWIDYPEGMSLADFRDKLREASAEISPLPVDLEIWSDQLQKYAPAEIKNSGLPVKQAYQLWQALKTNQEDGVKKEILSQALPRAIAEIQPKSDPYEVLDGIIRELRGDDAIEEKLTSFGDKAEMLARVKELLTGYAKHHEMIIAIISVMGKQGNQGKAERMKKWSDMLTNAIQPMLDRLAMLQEPELALILAMLTKQDYLTIWAKALGWKFEPTQAENDQ